MKAWFFATLVAASIGSADAATVVGSWSQPTTLTPTSLSISIDDDWRSVSFSLTSSQPYLNLFTGFLPATYPLAPMSVSGQGATLYARPGDYVDVTIRSDGSLGYQSFAWTITSTESLFQHLTGGYVLSACWFGNELCNDAKIRFWSGDERQHEFNFDLWTSPGQVPLPGSIAALSAGIAAITLARGRRKSTN